ncbi:hypothetical protein SGLAM104S_01612 [Streptomyces glaucescens]
MSKQQPERPLAPRPNQILAQPATVQACQRDYANADDIRRRLGWHDQGERR